MRMRTVIASESILMIDRDCSYPFVALFCWGDSWLDVFSVRGVNVDKVSISFRVVAGVCTVYTVVVCLQAQELL